MGAWLRGVAAACALWLAAAPGMARDAPVIAAAADLQPALEELAEAFHRRTGHRVRPSFGSTGNFARQIRAGAPFELFMAADESFVLDLHRDGFTLDEGRLYAIGRLALLLPRDSALQADGSLADLRARLADGTVRRFAIANPEHAPYGMRAEEALRRAGLWEAIQPHLVYGENVSQAAQFALSGNADGGLVAYSLVHTPRMAARGRHALVPADLHAPLRQRMALIRGAGPVARAFHDYLDEPEARAVLARHGFEVPGAD